MIAKERIWLVLVGDEGAVYRCEAFGRRCPYAIWHAERLYKRFSSPSEAARYGEVIYFETEA